jgi:hypothetical protein
MLKARATTNIFTAPVTKADSDTSSWVRASCREMRMATLTRKQSLTFACSETVAAHLPVMQTTPTTVTTHLSGKRVWNVLPLTPCFANAIQCASAML